MFLCGGGGGGWYSCGLGRHRGLQKISCGIITFITRWTRRVSPVEQELLSLPELLSSYPVFSEVRPTRSLVLCVCFIDPCLSFWAYSFDHCIFCSSLIYGFWLLLWYLQTLLTHLSLTTKFNVPSNIILYIWFFFFL